MISRIFFKNRVDDDADKNNDLALLVMDSDDDKSHFDYKDIVKNESRSKKAQKKAAKKLARSKGGQVENANEFKLDLQDNRFSAIFQNPKYNVDPSNPSFKKTKSMQEVIQEKQKRILQGDKIKSSERYVVISRIFLFYFIPNIYLFNVAISRIFFILCSSNLSTKTSEEPFKKRAKMSGLDSLVHSVQAKSKRMKGSTSRKNMKSKS